MSTYADLNDDLIQVDTSNDSIVIRQDLSDIKGGKTLNVVGFEPKVIKAGHMIIKETATGDYKPLPATDLDTDGVATTNNLVAGTGYANGTYENVPLQNYSQGARGKGALATVVVAGTVVTGVTITKKGSGYKVGDVLKVPGAYAGGTETTASTVTVATLGNTAAAYGALPSGHTYIGVAKNSVLSKKPFVGILTRGEVNNLAAPYDMTSILAAVKTALPQIFFTNDAA